MQRAAGPYIWVKTRSTRRLRPRPGGYVGHDNLIKRQFLRLFDALEAKHREDPKRYAVAPARFSWHGVRHVAVSCWIEARLAPKTVLTFAGHASEALVGNTIARILTDKGYRGHNAPPDYKFRVFISGQKRGVTPQIKRELRRRSAVKPVIGHLKAERRMGRNYLWFRQGDANNAILAAAGYNFRRLICWLRILLRQILSPLLVEPVIIPA